METIYRLIMAVPGVGFLVTASLTDINLVLAIVTFAVFLALATLASVSLEMLVEARRG